MKQARKDLNSTFVVSDTHFFHKNIIKYCSRPFDSIEEMNEGLIERWNSVVGKTDEVFHLGDFSFDSVKIETSESILSRLNGHKILIKGNHDNPKLIKSSLWSEVYETLKLKVENKIFILSHFPFDSWDLQTHGSFHLHGHMHTPKNKAFNYYKPRRMDCGVDTWDYHPVSLHSVLDKMYEMETFIEQNSISHYF